MASVAETRTLPVPRTVVPVPVCAWVVTLSTVTCTAPAMPPPAAPMDAAAATAMIDSWPVATRATSAAAL